MDQVANGISIDVVGPETVDDDTDEEMYIKSDLSEPGSISPGQDNIAEEMQDIRILDDMKEGDEREGVISGAITKMASVGDEV